MNSQTIVADLEMSSARFIDEARSIQNTAQEERIRVVKLGPIVFFSTLTGDAWMLDPEEGAATCLARGGEILAVPIHESRTDFTIEWQADYRIEHRAFIVTDRDSGAERAILGYPVEEIEKTLLAPAAESRVVAARERLKHGRNEPCPCGSGRKYKKCCLPTDEELARHATVESPLQPPSVAPALSDPFVPGITADLDADEIVPPRETREISETERQFNELWDWFNELEQPSAEQMDKWLQGLLALPPEATEWSDVMHTCAAKGHPDLPAVLRQIAAGVPHTRETGISFFYWAAVEEFMRAGLSALLPEVLAGFMALDEHSYNSDALVHIEDALLADRFETEALALAERFFPIIRDDSGLMPHVVFEKRNLIFQLRIGMALRNGPEAATSPQAVAQALQRDLEATFDEVSIDRAAQVVCETDEPDWTRARFGLMASETQDTEQARRAYLDLRDTLMRVAREAWRIDGVPPGYTFVGLSRLLESVHRTRIRSKTKQKSNRKGGTEPRANLLDYLNPTGMEKRIVQACPELIGINVPRARMMVDAYTVLLNFAGRHRLIKDGAAVAARNELVRLRGAFETLR